MTNNRAVASRSCRGFFTLIGGISMAVGLLGFGLPAFAASDAECPPPQTQDRSNWKSPDCGVHNMFVVGEKAMFLSHLPMYDSEHRYQVILQAKLKRQGQDVTSTYLKDRAGHPQTKMYTLEPADFFILSRVMAKDASAPSRKTFDAMVFRGHLERNPHQVISGLDKVEVEVQKLVYGAELTAQSKSPSELTYIVFGADSDLYLAHLIGHAPDFDQIVNVSFAPGTLTSEDIDRGVTLTIPQRTNAPDKRLKLNESAQGVAHLAGTERTVPVQLTVRKELYFEQGELMNPPKFGQTPLEKAAGF
jgi:hypothetical protein